MSQDVVQQIKDILDIPPAYLDKETGFYMVMCPDLKNNGVDWRPRPYTDQKIGKKYYEYALKLNNLNIPNDVRTIIKEINELRQQIQQLLKREAELKIKLKESIDKLVYIEK